MKCEEGRRYPRVSLAPSTWSSIFLLCHRGLPHAGGRAAVPALVRTAPRPSAPFWKTNNKCQIKFELIQLILCKNHHAAFDQGLLNFHPDTGAIELKYGLSTALLAITVKTLSDAVRPHIDALRWRWERWCSGAKHVPASEL